MGCDFSILVKQEFTEKITVIRKVEKKIEKKQKRIQRMSEEFTGITTPDLDIASIKKNLSSQLIKLEEMIEDVKKKKNDLSDSFDVSNSFEEIAHLKEKPPLAVINASSAKNSNNFTMSIKEKSLKSAGKLNTVESILEDPEIVALINKNRNKFMKKLTK